MSSYPDRNGASHHGPSWTATADHVRQLIGQYHALAPDAPAADLLHEIGLGIERVAGVDLNTAYELECELMDPHAGAADGWPPESDDWRWEAADGPIGGDEKFAASDTIYYLGDDGDGPDARLLLLVRPAHSSSTSWTSARRWAGTSSSRRSGTASASVPHPPRGGISAGRTS